MCLISCEVEDDEQKPCRPRENYRQPTVSTMPLAVQKQMLARRIVEAAEAESKENEKKRPIPKNTVPSAVPSSTSTSKPPASSSSPAVSSSKVSSRLTSSCGDNNQKPPEISNSSSSSSSSDENVQQPLIRAKPINERAVSFAKEKTPTNPQNISNSGRPIESRKPKEPARQPSSKKTEKQTTNSARISKAATPSKKVRFSHEPLRNSPIQKVQKKVSFSDMIEAKSISSHEVRDEDSDTSSGSGGSSSDSSGSSYGSSVDARPVAEPYYAFSGYYPTRGTYQLKGSGVGVRRIDPHSQSRRSSGRRMDGFSPDSDVIPTFRVRGRPTQFSMQHQEDESETDEESTSSGADSGSSDDYAPEKLGASRFLRQQASAPPQRLPHPTKKHPILAMPSRIRPVTQSAYDRRLELRRSTDSMDSLRTEFHGNGTPLKSAMKKDKKVSWNSPYVSHREESRVQINPVTGTSFCDV